MAENTPPQIQDLGDLRDTSFGVCKYIKVSTSNYRQLSWTEILEALHGLYPEKWAVQFFPPADQVVDEENVYHLFVLNTPPTNVNIKRS